jgi:hypothetical protein
MTGTMQETFVTEASLRHEPSAIDCDASERFVVAIIPLERSMQIRLVVEALLPSERRLAAYRWPGRRGAP